MNRAFGRLHREERGIALIWAMTTMFIVLTLSIVAINLAIHNSSASAQDRARTQAVNAAEAGIDVVYSQMGRTGFASLPCAQDSDLTTSPVEHYHVVVQYYATYPPTGNALTCPLTQNPVGAVITSTGTAPGASPTAPASSRRIRSARRPGRRTSRCDTASPVTGRETSSAATRSWESRRTTSSRTDS